MVTRKPKKASRSREYTGPNTLEGVKEFWLSNATQKAKTQAAERLSGEDQVEIVKWSVKRLQDVMKLHRRIMDAEWKRRGIKIPDK